MHWLSKAPRAPVRKRLSPTCCVFLGTRRAQAFRELTTPLYSCLRSQASHLCRNLAKSVVTDCSCGQLAAAGLTLEPFPTEQDAGRLTARRIDLLCTDAKGEYYMITAQTP